MSTASEAARAALERLQALWTEERRASEARYRAERRAIPLGERVARGLAADGLELREVEPAPGGRTLLWLFPRKPRALEGLRLGPGDPVLLWRREADGPETQRGTLARKRPDRLGVMLPGDPPEWLEEEDEAGTPLRLDQDDDPSTFDRGANAIRAFLAAPARSDAGRMREVLFGGAAPEWRPEPALEPLDPGLNPPQLAAVSRALAAGQVALVHGPPGTGKTRTLVEVIRQCLARGESVLACAASNAAVDNLAERLVAAGVVLLRLGHPARVSPRVEDCTLDAALERSEPWQEARALLEEAGRARQRLLKQIGKLGRDFPREERRAAWAEVDGLRRDARRHIHATQEALIQGAQVICATAAGADTALLGQRRFEVVVLDEATQAVDPLALVALLRGARAVLAGDHRQLPPTVISREAEGKGLGVTLFERLAVRQDADALRQLTVQHRMHRDLMEFPSQSMYAGTLVAAPEVAGHVLEGLPGVRADPLRPGPLVFLDAAGAGWEEERAEGDPSTRNPRQAERMTREVRRLLSRGLDPRDAAVIAPYDAQVRLLRELLREEIGAGLEVGTVDGFQGREKEAILIDLVRSNERGELGFLGDVRRMNVALTRARRFLLVLGDGATLGGHSYYGDFLAAAEALGAWKTVWEDEADPLE